MSARSSTDRASDYGSEGLGFESLRARSGCLYGETRVETYDAGDTRDPQTELIFARL